MSESELALWSEYAADRAARAREVCVCGHVLGHHRPFTLGSIARHDDCTWSGCGCPRYLTVDRGSDKTSLPQGSDGIAGPDDPAGETPT